ncbi:MAG: Lrp/AsnC family transcriptional regulator [Candidatus Micrarchaeota archaeon]
MARAYDDLDIKILRELREDSKQSYKKLSEKLKTHPNTLMQRIKKLEKDGVIKKYSVEVDYRKLGLEFRAIVILRTRTVKVTTPKEFDHITRMPQVIALYGTAGQYDAMAIVEVHTMKELTEVIGRIQDTPGVVRTSTYLILSTYKHSSDYNPFKQ